MLWSPNRGIWCPSRRLLASLTLREWDQGTRPWHKDPHWRPGKEWSPSLYVQRRMHALGIIFPGTAQVRREVTQGGVSVGPGVTPFSFWRLEEASGNRVDSGTAGHDLTPHGTVLPGNTTGKIGNALLLNGVNQYVDGTGMTLGSGVSFTFGLWGNVGVLNASEEAWGAQINNSFTQGWFLGDDGSASKHPRIYGKPNGQALKTVDDSGITFSLATWYFLTIRFSTSDNILRIRTNDTSEATVSCSSYIVDGGSFALGNGQESIYFNGALDAAAYFQSSLSASDMTAWYNSGVGTEYYSGAWH